jgi:outer membrane protein
MPSSLRELLDGLLFCRASLWAQVVVAGVLCLGAPGASAETLLQALTDAYRYNPQLDSQRAQQRATDEEVPRAKSGYRPVITGNADVGYETDRIRPKQLGSPSGEIHPRGYGLNVTQPIFNGFQTTNQVRISEALVREGRSNLEATEQQILLDAVTAFGDVLRDQAVVQLRENNVNVLTRELKATQDRFSVGEVTRTDVAQAQARRAGAVSDLDAARANLKTSRAAYERIIGHPPSNLTVPPIPENLIPKALEGAQGIALQENPNVVAALYREQQARFTVDRIWGELLPSAQIDADYTRRYDPSRSIDQLDTGTVTGRVTVPIYQGGEVEARVRQAKQTHIARLQEVELVRTQAIANVVTAWSQLQAARAQLVSDQATVSANQIALTGVREEERVGQRTLLDVLNAELELVTSQVNLVTTRRNLLVAAYSVVSAVGRLNAQRLALGTQVYDPEAHYFDVRRKWWGISITHGDGRREYLDLWETHGQVEPSK